MQQAEEKARWFFVDEAGDPNFYGKGKKLNVGQDGCSRTFTIGFLRTHDAQQIRAKLGEVRLEIANSRYLKSIPSLTKSLTHFHAKDDCPEVRKLVFEALDKMDFAAQFIVARKREHIFCNKYNGSTGQFYDDLVKLLFRGQLHLASENHIVFARRGNKARQAQLRAAVELSVDEFCKQYNTTVLTKVNVNTDQPIQEAALQAIDYANWAVQRAFERGEMRYFDFLRQKIERVWDVYDLERIRAKQSVVYDRKKNPFQIKTASPLS